MASTLVATPAFAAPKQVMTPIGEIDPSCIHEVPVGAAIDTYGKVTKGGSVIDQHTPCTASAGQSTTTTTKGGATSFWYEFSWANATPVQGYQAFNDFEGKSSVPAAPSNPGSSVVYLFPSLENFDSAGTWYSIIQPIIQWGYNNYDGGEYWILQAMIVDLNNNVSVSPVCYTSPGHHLYWAIGQLSEGPDEWLIYIADTDTNCYTYYYYYPDPAWPKYDTAQGGVIEGYGNAAETMTLQTCAALPTSNGQYFTITSFYEGGPYWNNQNTPNVAWQAYNDPSNWYPNFCAWNVYAASNSGTVLTWNYQN